MEKSKIMEEEAEEEAEEPTEESRDLARAMLLEGKLSEAVAKETGLSLRTVWGLKGALARSGKIMKRAEIEIKEIAGVQERGEDVPFRREKTAPELIVEICKKYGVKDRAVRIIADRCQRVPGGVLHPSDFERLLIDLDSGLKKRESMLIAEEYDLALATQRAEAEEFRRGYYTERGGGERGRPYYHEPEDYYRRPGYESTYEARYDRYGRTSSPEYGRPDVTRYDMEAFERRILDGVRKEKETDRIDKALDAIKGHGEDIATLATELKNVKENPPVVASQGDSDYEKTLKHTIERQDKRIDEMLKEMKEQGKEYRDLIREMREDHREEVKELGEKVSKAEKEAHSGEGYRDDTLRLADRGLNRLADVIEKKEPIKILVEKGGELLGEERRPPEREKVGESRVANQIPEEYLEL